MEAQRLTKDTDDETLEDLFQRAVNAADEKVDGLPPVEMAAVTKTIDEEDRAAAEVRVTYLGGVAVTTQLHTTSDVRPGDHIDYGTEPLLLDW